MKTMRVHGDRVLELSEQDLGNPETLAAVAERVEAETLIYAPVAEPVQLSRVGDMREEPQWWHEPPPAVKPAKLDDPRRLDALRVALSGRGLTIEHVGCFYGRVVSLASEAKRSAS